MSTREQMYSAGTRLTLGPWPLYEHPAFAVEVTGTYLGHKNIITYTELNADGTRSGRTGTIITHFEGGEINPHIHTAPVAEQEAA